MILLNIVHGLARRLPRHIDLSLLGDIAILVDKYGLHEVTEVYTGAYFRDLYGPESSLPSQLTDWIFVAWVFGMAVEFKQLTRDTILTCGSQFQDKGLPLPDSLASK